MVEAAVLVEAAGSAGQDRAIAVDFAGGKLIVVADGVGGISGGAEAAQAVVACVHALPQRQTHDWASVLRGLDLQLSSSRACGETTAIVAFITGETIVGASLGDSGGWMLASGAWLHLLEDQRRKPLLGSGSAIPIGFGPHPMGDRVLFGSDGLFKYVDAQRIGELASMDPLERAASELVAAARLPSGRLQDDVAIVLAGYPRDGCRASS